MLKNKSESSKFQVVLNYNNEKIPIYQYDRGKIHFHSFYSVEKESQEVFEEYYKVDRDDYVFWGFGFGYHIKKFLNNGANITIIILNQDCFQVAKEVIELSYFNNNPKVQFIELLDNKKISKFINELFKKKAIHIFHTPSIEAMEDNDIKFLIQSMHIRNNSYKLNEKLMIENYNFNITQNSNDLTEFIHCMKDKNVMITAGGPSLKYDIDTIKSVRSDIFLFSVGTVLKTLLSNDITPDAIIITDPTKTVVNQIEDVYLDKPLVILSTANRGLLEKWEGEKIICYQEEFNIPGNQLLVNTGGSVTTTALDIVLKAKAKSVVLAGCDFSYPENLSHVDGATSQRSISLEDYEYIKVKNYQNGKNLSSQNLNMFRRWIEDRIKDENIRIFNITKMGAVIKGTIRKDSLTFNSTDNNLDFFN